MDIKLTQDPIATKIHLQGRFDFASHHGFREACSKAFEHLAKEIHVDLAGVDYIDSAALGMLLILRDKCAVSARTLTLLRPSADVFSIFKIANFAQLFDIREVASR
jgi:anti-anti-sigma factor